MTRRRTLHALSLALCLGHGSLAKKDKNNGGGVNYALPYPQNSQPQQSSSSSDDSRIPLTRVPPVTGPNLLWHDEFVGNGSPDSTYWNVDPSSQVSTSDHYLRMLTSSDSRQTTASHMSTDGRVVFTYGTLEARIKVPDMQSGIWSTFWTLGQSYREGWPSVGEVAIMEMGYEPTNPQHYINHRVRSSVHYDTINGQYDTYSKNITTAQSLSDDFHVYRMEWTPDTMTTFVDDQWVWEIDINEDVCPACSELHLPHHIHLNLAVGGRFGCVENCGRFARGEMLVDYVRLYDNGHTVGTVNGADWIPRGSANSKGSTTQKKSKGVEPKIPVRKRRRLSTSNRTPKGARTRRVRGSSTIS